MGISEKRFWHILNTHIDIQHFAKNLHVAPARRITWLSDGLAWTGFGVRGYYYGQDRTPGFGRHLWRTICRRVSHLFTAYHLAHII
jgi:hypothetical protein